MPRRVYTYPAGLGWDGFNLASTFGAFMIAAGVLVFLVDLARNFRMAMEDNAGNVWNAGTLEWLPNGVYATRSIPIVRSREPLWDQPRLADDVEAGRYYLPGSATGERETIVTSPVDATPQWLLRLPMPGWPPFIAALFTAAFFLLLTVKWTLVAAGCGVVAVGAMLRWGWELDRGPRLAPVDIGGGVRLPVYASGPLSHTWWAVLILIAVTGTTYACLVFSYVYLWVVNPAAWPAQDALPPAQLAWAGAALFLLSSAAVAAARRALERDAGVLLDAALGIAMLFGLAGFALELYAHRALAPTESSYGALVHTFASFNGFGVLAGAILAAYALARRRAGLLDSERRNVFDNARLLWHYVVAQNLGGLALVHGFPRWVG
jgi:cytochrome c oxidase subunit I+III